MHDHSPRWFLDRYAIRAHLVGDVLSVEIRGRFTAPRLHTALQALRTALRDRDYGALVINALDAQMAVSLQQLALLWKGDACPLSARPCALVFDAKKEGARGFYEALGVQLAYGLPPRLIGVFDGALMVSAVHWAQKRALNFRAESARREAQASSRGSSGKR